MSYVWLHNRQALYRFLSLSIVFYGLSVLRHVSEEQRCYRRSFTPPAFSQWLCSSPLLPGTQQEWTTLPASSASGLKWPLWPKSLCTLRFLPSSCPGYPVGQPLTRAGTAPSAEVLEDGARQLHCWVSSRPGWSLGIAGGWGRVVTRHLACTRTYLKPLENCLFERGSYCAVLTGLSTSLCWI